MGRSEGSTGFTGSSRGELVRPQDKKREKCQQDAAMVRPHI